MGFNSRQIAQQAEARQAIIDGLAAGFEAVRMEEHGALTPAVQASIERRIKDAENRLSATEGAFTSN